MPFADGDQRRHHPRGRLRRALRRRPGERHRHGRRSAPPASSSASTRWAARPSTTGSRSPTATAWISPSPTRRSIPTFRFMTLDHDGKIRMDCSSPYAMASLVKLKDRFDVAFGNDPDSDRHGIVTKSTGLMNPNHYLAVAIRYLLTHRADWPAHAAVGKTLVSSSLIDRVVSEPRPAALPRCRSASSGSRPGCSTARSASAARRAPAPASCGATAPSGRPTRTARSSTCSPPRSLARTGKDPGEHYQRADRRVRHALLHADRRRRRRRSRRRACRSFDPIRRQGAEPGRRADHGQADPRARQRRRHRRPEGRRRRAAGSRRVPPAPRTSTRSTPRASATRRIWTPSSPRPSRSSLLFVISHWSLVTGQEWIQPEASPRRAHPHWY